MEGYLGQLELRYIPGKGYGLVATQDIAQVGVGGPQTVCTLVGGGLWNVGWGGGARGTGMLHKRLKYSIWTVWTVCLDNGFYPSKVVQTLGDKPACLPPCAHMHILHPSKRAAAKACVYFYCLVHHPVCQCCCCTGHRVSSCAAVGVGFRPPPASPLA
jgi:hypothetical protein